MKKILIVAIVATAFLQNSFAQDSVITQPSPILSSYYELKNALVAGNATTASLRAEEFVMALNAINVSNVNEDVRNGLFKDAGYISTNKNINKQRELFATFSTNMYALAKAMKLTANPVYYAYCPMKKAYWLSSEAAIKNPYFGSAMLTCGKVAETIK